MRILSIETSCDETSVSVLECSGGSKKPRFRILSNVVLSQIPVHESFGGVVPSLARREHQRNLTFILIHTLREARLLKSKIKNKKLLNKKIKKILKREPELSGQLLEFLREYEASKIDLIAVTRGPGLEPALWVGVNFARALSLAWQVPLIGVNHLEGHIFSVFLKKNRKNFQFLTMRGITRKATISNFQFPALALVVSGGHTELVLMEDWLKYKIIGSTLDDAAGEAFDKAARILGLGYPGGPAIAAEAAKFPIFHPTGGHPQGDNFQFSNKFKIELPRPMLNSKDFNFSFSGLKTAVLYLTQNLKKSGKWSENLIPNIAHKFQEAVIDVLIKKSLKAVEKYNVKTFILCGGVSANKELRYRLSHSLYEKHGKDFNFLMPNFIFSGDNAAMIGVAAYSNYLNLKSKGKLLKITPSIKADGNLNF